MYRFWKGFWLLANPKFWIASTVPMLVGTALAYGVTGSFNLYWFLISIIGLYFIEIGKMAANDWVDYITGVDFAVPLENITPYSGGRNRVLVNGYLCLRDVTLIAVVMLCLGGLFGIYISLFREPQIFWIGTAGLFLAVAYSLPPFKFAYRGLGELAVGLAFGPLIVSGAFVIQTHFLTGEVFLVSLPIGFLITNILFINQYPDYEADILCNKRNWLVRLGKTKGLKLYVSLFILAYVSVIMLFILTKNPFWLLSFISLPMVIHAVRVTAISMNDIPNLIPANVSTLWVYQINGLTMLLSALLKRFL
ncbi:MAG: prenyltransferase [Firmicutes bacterium]|nr:prenyltransferase [Bacillota bacterium]